MPVLVEGTVLIKAGTAGGRVDRWMQSFPKDQALQHKAESLHLCLYLLNTVIILSQFCLSLSFTTAMFTRSLSPEADCSSSGNMKASF